MNNKNNMSIKPLTIILNNLTINTEESTEPKKRGRPKKNISTTSEDKIIEPKKRGRPKKNILTTSINREEPAEPEEPKKRGRPKKNISITIDTSDASSESSNEPKKRGRPKKNIEIKEINNNDSSSESESENNHEDNDEEIEEIEGFYIKLDKTCKKGYIFVSSIQESEYIIRPNLKLYNPHTFIYCGIWDPISKGVLSSYSRCLKDSN